jgi:hypothetical protein
MGHFGTSGLYRWAPSREALSPSSMDAKGTFPL